MRRIVYILIAVIVAGCGKEARLTFHVGGTAGEIKVWEEIAGDFARESGKQVILLRSTTQTEQRKQSILVSLRSRNTDPDVMLMDVAWIGQMASSGWLEPLDKYSSIDRSVFFDRIVDLADTWQSTLVGVPVYVDGGLLYYRQDILDKYGYRGPPQTWNELRDMALRVTQEERKTRPDFWGYVWQGAQYEGLVCNALEFFASAGGSFLDSTGNPMLDTPQNLKALTCMVSLVRGTPVSPPNTFTDMKEDEVRQMFQNGDALFERNWPYAWPLHNSDESAVNGKVGACVLPHFDDNPSASTLGGWHAAISRFSDRKDDAAAFVAYITSYAVQKKLAAKLGYNPGRKDVYADKDLLASYPLLAQLQEVFANAVPRPSVPWYSQLSLVMQKHFNAALAGRETPENALRLAQSETLAVTERARGE